MRSTVAQHSTFWLLTSYYQIRTRPTSHQFGSARIMVGEKNVLNDDCNRPITLPGPRGKLTLSVPTYFKEAALGEAGIKLGGPEEGPAIV